MRHVDDNDVCNWHYLEIDTVLSTLTRSKCSCFIEVMNTCFTFLTLPCCVRRVSNTDIGGSHTVCVKFAFHFFVYVFGAATVRISWWTTGDGDNDKRSRAGYLTILYVNFTFNDKNTCCFFLSISLCWVSCQLHLNQW